MKRIIITFILTFFVFATGYSQAPKKTETKPTVEATTKAESAEVTAEGNVYREILVQDFENIEFKDSDIVFQKSRDEEFKVGIRDETPAPVTSKKYLGIKLRGTRSNAIQIKFPKDKIPTIDKYCHSISIWVYGKNFTGDLSLFIMDNVGKTHKLAFGKLNFHGWHKITKILPAEIIQSDKMLEQKSSLKILSILYIPGTWFKPGTNVKDPVWQTFYIDDITAKVREKYKDSQNDEW